MDMISEIAAPIDAPTLAADAHPDWCSREHCRRHDYVQTTVVAHASRPVQIPLFDAVLELQLWLSCRYGESLGDDGPAAPAGTVVSVRRMAHSGPTADDRHDVLTLYAARLMHKALGTLITQAAPTD